MNVMQLKREIREGVTHLMKGVTHLRRGLPPPWRGEKGARGFRTPMGCSPFSYIRWHLLSSFRHLVHSIPYHVAPPIRQTLSEALPKLIATNTWRSAGGGGVLRIPTSATPLDRGHGGRDRIVRVTEYGGAAGSSALYTILSSSSERLHRLCTSSSSLHWKRLCRNANSTSSLWGLVNRCFHLVDDLG
jgi:hypothetical protein